MTELDLLLLRLEDMTKSASNNEVKLLAKSLKRFLESSKGKEFGFVGDKDANI